MKVKSFSNKWKRFKKDLNEQDLELFYEVVDIDGSVGRRLLQTIKDFNPRYNVHWFACGRCHWNVILPCYLLNSRDTRRRYAILTNDHHSVIIDTFAWVVYDPTYEFNGGSFESTLTQLDRSKSTILFLDKFIESLDDDMYERFQLFKDKYCV